MKIQLGSITINKTKKYLAPCLKVYGTEFEKKISSVWKIGLGIGDTVTIKSNILFEKHIFILCEVNKDVNSFLRFMEWIKEQDMYEDDYVFDDIKNGCLHMLVVKLPEECYESFETFKRSQFSKMYSKEDVQKFFDSNSDTIKVLIRDHNYKVEFSNTIKKEYGVDLPVSEIDDNFELDFPLTEHEEVFNTHLK